MSVRCPECGAEILAGHRYCTECNYELTGQELLHKSRRNSNTIIISIIAAVFVCAGIAAMFFLSNPDDAEKNENENRVAHIPIAQTAAPVNSTSASNTIPVSASATLQNTLRIPNVVHSAASSIRTATPIVPTPTPFTNVRQQMTYGTHSVVNTNDELAELIQEMLLKGYDRVDLGGFNVPDMQNVIEAFPAIESIMIYGNSVEIEWHPGVRIAHAHRNGTVDLLSYNEKIIYDKAIDILDSILAPNMSELNMELAIHDYIIYNCNYEINLQHQTDSVYGFFNYGKCQCSGYVDTFYMLGTIAGLDIRSVSGTINEGNASHAWNLILLDGKWYAVDVTYDDPIQRNNEHHGYLNIPVNFLHEDRTWKNWAHPQGIFAQILDDKWYYGDIPLSSTNNEAINAVKREFTTDNEAFIRTNGYSVNLQRVANEIQSIYNGRIYYSEIFNMEGIKVVRFWKE